MSQTAPSPTVTVAGNVSGDIIVGDNNFKVNTNYGTIVYKQAAPRVQRREAVPQPGRAPRGFVNREDELARIEQMIAGDEAVALSGMDGVGKSALIKKAASGEAARAMPGGVVIVPGIDAEGTRLGPDDVIQRLFDALYESEPRLKVDFTTARTYLSNTRPLVVLDGLDLPAEALARLPELFPTGALLIESNRSLPREAANTMPIGALPRADAVALLTASAEITPDDTNQGFLDAICALLGDVPLAIVKTGDAIRDKKIPLDEARRTLDQAQPKSSDPMQAGVERAWALIESAMSENERRLAGVAAWSPGATVDPDWLRAAMKNARWAGDAVGHLQTMGMLHANSPRLSLDPGLRAMARAGIDETFVKDRLVDYLIDALKNRSLDWSFCSDELGNVLGAIEWAVGRRNWRAAIQLARAIDPYLTLHGQWDAWRAILDRTLEAARAVRDRAVEGWALHQLGTHALGAGQTNQAIDLLRQALDVRRALGDTVGMAYTQHNLDLLIPPAPPSGREPEPQPKPKAPQPRNVGAFRLLTLAVVTVIVGFIVYMVINQPRSTRPTPPPQPPPPNGPSFAELRVDVSFETVEVLKRIGAWRGIVTLRPSGGQPPYVYDTNWGSDVLDEPYRVEINAGNCEPAYFEARVASQDDQERFVQEEYQPAECENFSQMIGMIWYFSRPNDYPGEDPRVQQGVNLLIDYTALREGYGLNVLYRDAGGGNPTYEYDPERGVELLYEADVTFLTISFYESDDQAAAAAEVISAMLSDYGIEAQPIPESSPDPGNYEGDIIISR